MSFPECDRYPKGSRAHQICCGEVPETEVPRDKINAWRIHQGLWPIGMTADEWVKSQPKNTLTIPLSAMPSEPKEPVGAKLSEVIKECGIVPPATCACNAMQHRMNMWGVDGCNENRQIILDHLNEATQKSSWLDMIKAASRGYLTIGMMLDEAIKRATSLPFRQSQNT